RVGPGKTRAEQHDHGAVAPRRRRLLRAQRRRRADARAQQQEDAATQRTPPMRLRTGLSNRAITTAAPRVTAAVTPNKVGSGSANFAGDDGCRGPSRTHSHANSGDRMITNAA